MTTSTSNPPSKIRKDHMGFGDLDIYQDPKTFCYGVDAVILADFATKMCKNPKKIADLGCGNGAISLVLSHKIKDVTITAVEVQKDIAKLAIQSVALNKLENRINVVETDLRTFLTDKQAKESYDTIVSNPPYVPWEEGHSGENVAKAMARHEIEGTLEDFIKTASYMLEDKGNLCMIHRPRRLVDILTLGRMYQLEAKNMRFVAPRKGEEPNLVLIHFVKKGGKNLRTHTPLYVYEGSEYSPEIMGIYER